MNDCDSDGICPFKREGENCYSHIDCGVGNYCHSDDKVCIKLEIKETFCNSDFMCKNNHGCYQGKCTDYYSLPLGTNMNDTVSEFKEKLCITDSIKNGKCYGKYYASDMNPDSNGMVECGFNSDSECKYIDSENYYFTEKCNCGYNKEGKGYCNRAFDGYLIFI